MLAPTDAQKIRFLEKEDFFVKNGLFWLGGLISLLLSAILNLFLLIVFLQYDFTWLEDCTNYSFNFAYCYYFTPE